MKKCVAIMLLTLLLCGCSKNVEFETVGNQCMEEPIINPCVLELDLPQELATPVLQNEQTDKIYLCDGYTLSVQTLQGGDLDATLQNCTGFGKDRLSLIETVSDGIIRYDCVWVSAGEGTEHVGRLALLDDGAFHYVVTAMAPAETAGTLSETWNAIFDSIKLNIAQ